MRITWLKDPITLIGFMNLSTMMQLTLYRTYLAVFLESDLLIGALIISIILSSLNFFQTFMRVPLAGFSQVVGRRAMILFGNFSIALAMLLLVFTSDPLLAFFSSILVGIGMSSHWPATFAYIRDVSPDNYGKSNGKIFKIGDIGIIFGTLLAKYLLDGINIEFREFFLILFLLGLFAVLFFYIFLPEVIDENEKVKVASYSKFLRNSILSMFSDLKKVTKYPGLGKIYGFQFVISFTEFIFSSLFGALIVYKGFSKGTPSEIIFWSTLLILWLKPYLGNISDRFGYEDPSLISLIIAGILFAIVVFVNDLIILVLIYLIFTGCMFVAYPAVNGATAKTSISTERGIALGSLGVYTSLGRASSTIILAPFWEIFNLNIAFLFASGFLLTVLILYIIRKILRTNSKKTVL